ncbi:MAG: hypothetical protein ACTHKY_13425 [Ginsengibacter sp.]
MHLLKLFFGCFAYEPDNYYQYDNNSNNANPNAGFKNTAYNAATA